jgi:site-specific DNA recombinase
MLERTKPKAIRCAVYTRKSSDEGLDQDFNSLHAQREACEAFIASQRHEGWKLIETAYDDGGFSGGSMQRPALQTLLNDVHAGKIDAVVVYKVDRLTRSLTDFAKIVEVFDAQGVSFVSVTQAFNTTTSMGRLTLNVLLSFAQFEREVTGERIRDKIAASKKKGLWMGGFLPVGYKASHRTLVIDDPEAAIVRAVYDLYLRHGTVAGVQVELARRKIVKPEGLTTTGRRYGGRPFSRGQIYRLLSNPIYLGQIAHKGSRYDGQHDAIIEQGTWDAVQTKLANNTHARHVGSNARDPSLLAGLLYGENGHRLSPTHASKKGKRYRYYASSDGSARRWRIAALEIEGIVIERLCAALLDRRWLVESLGLDDATPDAIGSILDNATALSKELSSASGPDQRSTLLAILRMIHIAERELRIDVRHQGLMMALSASLTPEAQKLEPKGPGNQHPRAQGVNTEEDVITLLAPVAFKRRGRRDQIDPGRNLVLQALSARPDPDQDNSARPRMV